MSAAITGHKLPDDYFDGDYYQSQYTDYLRMSDMDTDKGAPSEMVGKARMLQSLLDKWDNLMNDPDVSDADKAMLKAIFMGKMNALEQADGGLSQGEGFDDVLAAIESGDSDALDQILLDTVDMDQLFEAFGQAYQTAVQVTNIKPQTDDDRLARMYFTNDWDGLKRYELDHKADGAKKG